MNFLSIDCSTNIGSLFIKNQNKTFIKVLQNDKSNIDLLMKKILDFCEESGLKIQNISNIFVNQGPGSFSGLRSSLAVAKGISLAQNVNIFGYNTFIWVASKFFDKENFIYSLIKIRDKYFIKEFNKKLITISKFREMQKYEIIKKFSNKFLIIPENISSTYDEKILKLNNLKIVDLDHNNLEFLQKKGLLDKHLIKPIYIG
ncbi:MAG: tRNA A37 threonylcarbamoyladenosine modification protein TsaB [Pelagibacterales bacterium]|nr:tRNA A37 threonylcarbamoyladenosine modification protein TsaB [Pelagibacterales bacterium]